MSTTVAFRCYGVTVAIEIGDPALEHAVARILPPKRSPAAGAGAHERFTLHRLGGDTFALTTATATLAHGVSEELALRTLDASIRQAIASRSPEMIFVHAGVVAHHGRALVLPGGSFTGKTELVVALLRAGAVYYSDEFALLDDKGLVHPYPRRLSVRERGSRTAHQVAADELGAATGTIPVEPAIIALAQYQPGARWRPQTLTPAAAALELLAHAGQGRAEPERTLHAVHNLAERALTLKGPRGEAAETAAALLDALRD
jgi:hypothetical protein